MKTGAKHTKTSGPKSVLSRNALAVVHVQAYQVTTISQATIPTMRQAATSGEELVECAMSPNGMNQACRCATAPLGLNSVLGLGV